MSSQPTNPRKRPHPTSTNSKPHPKRQRTNPSTSNHPPPLQTSDTLSTTPTALAPLKKRQRDLTRLLASHTGTTLPATIKAEHEREIQSLRSEIADAEAEAVKREEERKRNKIIGRYHRVRFFERRKAQRRLKALRKGADGGNGGGDVVEGEEDMGAREGRETISGEARRQLRRAIHDAEVDLQYTMFYPLDEAYVSLFASGDTAEEKAEEDQYGASTHDDAAEEGTEKEKPKMWFLVEEALEQGQAALDALREGRWRERYQDAAQVVEVKAVRKTPKVVKAKVAAKPAVSKESKVHAPNGVKQQIAASEEVTESKKAAVDSSKDSLHLIRGNRRMRRAAEAEEKARKATAEDEGDQKGLDFFE